MITAYRHTLLSFSQGQFIEKIDRLHQGANLVIPILPFL
jgi:hypothetical protein